MTPLRRGENRRVANAEMTRCADVGATLTLECCALFRFRVNAAAGGSRFREAAGRSRLRHFNYNRRRTHPFAVCRVLPATRFQS
jgi:hypothetical protein